MSYHPATFGEDLPEPGDPGYDVWVGRAAKPRPITDADRWAYVRDHFDFIREQFPCSEEMSIQEIVDTCIRGSRRG